MSKNYELMQQAGRGIGRRKPVHTAVVQAEENFATQLTSGARAFDDDKASNWLRAFGVLQKHWRLSALFGCIVMAAVAATTFFTKPVYEATARIEIDPSGEKFSLENSGSGANDAEYLETQAQILKGDSLAIAVIRKLRLDQNPLVVDDVSPSLLKKAKTDASDSLQLTPKESMALINFKTALKVRRDTASRLILVSYSSHNPELAAQVSNTMVQSFIDQSFQTRHDAIMKSSEWLSRQLDDIRKKMEDSSQALTQFQQSIGVADIDTNKSTFTEHMGELSRQQTQAQSERIQLQALLKNVNGNPDALPDVRSNPVVQQLSQKLAEDRAGLSQALVVYGSNHPTAKKLQTEVNELESQIESQKKAILNSVRASYAAATARESLMTAEMKGTGKELDKVAQYTNLKKEVEANVALYNSLYGRIKEAGISAASKSADIQIVDPARVPDEAVSPRPILNLAIGLLAAVIGGIGLAFGLEELDNKLHSPEDIKTWIGIANVSIIPAISESDYQEGRLGLPKRMAELPASQAEDSRANAFFLERPNSPEGEALQALYASIMLSWPNNPPQTLLIVSAFPGEGKTTIALNLSFALAQHANTCLVDADLRKGRVARAFGLPSRPGLGDVLSGDASLESSMLEIPGMSNLSVVPSGRSEGNFGQLICSEKMEQVLTALRERFRFIVIDSAPILPFADGRVLSTLADAVVLVGRAGVTTRQALRRSVELISEVHGAPILQVVLNGADRNSTDYKYYGYGHSYTESQSG